MAQEKAWDEYWSGADSIEAVGGSQRHKLAAHWKTLFGDAIQQGSKRRLIVDVAAGAGVALLAAIEAHNSDGVFLALDYSPAAAATARAANKAVLGAAADAAMLPLRDGCADFVISQFGLEYAGAGAFGEAARVVSPGGHFCSLSHFSNGAIDLECAENERLLEAIFKLNVFAAARATFQTSYARQSRRDPKPIDVPLDAAFASALATAKSAAQNALPLAARTTLERFLSDLTRLSARRFAFEPAEAIDWLTGMEASLGAYLKRMQSMRASALDRMHIEAIAAQFRAAGLAGFKAEPLYLDETRPPAAWVIEAHRPA